MRLRLVALTVVALMIFALGHGWTDEPVKGKAVKVKNMQFEQMKKLVGKWSGKASHGDGKTVDTSVTYKLTGAGATLMETLFCESPHEMVTMYHLDGDKLLLTHYCAAGNQPRMKAQPSDNPKIIVFKFLDGTNLDAGRDFHMHNAEIQFLSDDHIRTMWVSYKDGQPAGKALFDLKRQKGE
jgi:hypothetical protein